ncbi:glycerophosphoryl diester phosphodiesterase membrane domain-containing protein [Streptomyces sp. NPDC054949]|uniref:glycerophosphoryl diester phosphodiesterase membrane domain-containing protein n=1 Tax=Streptomyces sp. NBC_00291 TaxID=2975704 RepID=UPI0022508555|nr:glycerophosphoryl diester phosphodiesterase membrane domain-containing protein [Streptomyces sp. NBC_00291]MCX5153267.1 glycerophosphoryl diester phosphodiesterase membrane domain-containing protein [Streptomyces sp. NBC_00291]
MNDSPGWATPGSSPSEDRSGQDGQGSKGSGSEGGAGGTQPPAQPSDDPRWSAAQPPPGQWSNPGTGEPAPAQAPQPQQGPGWGSPGQQPGARGGPSYGSPYGGQYGNQYGAQYGPYGHPGAPWGPPPAAKPGVIPLRPLGLGEILDGAVSTMRSHWRSVLPITLVVAVIVQVFGVLVQKYVLADLDTYPRGGSTVDLSAGDIVGYIALTGATYLVQILGTILATAMLTMIFSRAILGQPSSVATAWRESRSQLPRLIGLTLLVGLALTVAVGVLIVPAFLFESLALAALTLLVLAPVIVWLGVALSLASPALMLEKSTVSKAIARSWKLVKGSWWRIFGITLLTGIITAIITGIIYYPLSMIGVFGFGNGLDSVMDGSASSSWGFLIFGGVALIIAQTITMPIQAGVTVLLYVDQRIRREALDLDLARAAGIDTATDPHPGAAPGHGG